MQKHRQEFLEYVLSRALRDNPHVFSLSAWPNIYAWGSNMALGFRSVLVSAKRQLVWA